ncbi:MAG: alpha/beta hydrolase [Ilumatobacteraceae bacterium]
MTGRDTAPIWSEEKGPHGAPIVVLVHGSMDRSAGLLRLSRRLDRTCRVLRYDRRGYGRSSPHAGPFTMTEQVADLDGLVAGRRVVVFGHSYGGNVALAYAARRPDLVRAVGVYEAPLSWMDWWPGSTAGGSGPATDGEPADAAERFMRRMVGDAMWERLPAGTRAARRAEGPAMIEELTDVGRHAPWTPGSIVQHVVAMHGTRGARHHIAATVLLGTILPDCQVVTIDGARHDGPNSHADAVAAEIGSLVTRAATTP